MKLFLNHASPYARLARVLVIEAKLDGQTELVYVDPWASSQDMLAANPASKVPALMLDDGRCLVDSTCIADYLMSQPGRGALSPLSHPDATVRLQILGLARAAIECALGAVVQERFAANSPLTERWLRALPRIATALDSLYAERQGAGACDLADLTVGVAFEYLDFRLPETGWKDSTPRLAKRVADLARRDSFQATRPR